jgi:phosphomevalonate kinase
MTRPAKFDVRATAPGKLLLVGEYAVLNGQPALAAAVGVRASAHLVSLAGDFNELYVSHSKASVQFRCGNDGSVDWRTDPGRDGSLLVAVIATLQELGIWRESEESFRIELDSRKFSALDQAGNRQKLGLGSSASVCVALTAVLSQRMGFTPEYSSILAAHRRFQQGRGSGVDVACSYAGGVVEYFRSLRGAANVRSLSWPQGLYVLPVWSGVSASTSLLLDRLAVYQEKSSNDYEHYMADIGAASAYAIAQWEAGQPAVILAALQDFSERLQALDAAANIGIWSEVHQRLGRIAAESGAVYKPSGAGGGDFGLAFSSDEAKLENLAEVYREQGFLVPTLEFSVGGLEVVAA